MKRRSIVLPKALLGVFCIVFVVIFYKLLFGIFEGVNVERTVPVLKPTQSTFVSGNEKLSNELKSMKIAVLVVACNRPSVKRCLDLLLQAKQSFKHFPIIVSQDCGHSETSETIRAYGDAVKYIQHQDTSKIDVPQNMMHLQGYYKLARHYKWALTQVFDIMKYDTVIIVEDDLEVAPDFFEYFTAAIPLLRKDPTLWCVSAWNDNGKFGYVRGNDILYRSDFFPGLGWAMTNSVWNEIKVKWPKGFWDDWMRHPDQRKGRACIRPEISRTRTFGRIGVSNGQFFDQHLKKIQLNTKFYPFSVKDMSYLLKENYDKSFKEIVYNAKLVSPQDIIQRKVEEDTVRIEYRSKSEFISIAKMLSIMSDLKAGVPRMAYLGIVSIMYEHYRVFIVPGLDWKGYVVGN